MENPSVFPSERSILPPFALPDHEGRTVDVETFRQQRNLVLIFIPALTQAVKILLRMLSEKAEAIALEDAVVVAVVQGSRKKAQELHHALQPAFYILADEEGDRVSRFSGSEPSLYITDRFREIFTVRRGDRLFSADEVLEWLAHINRQCPE